MSVAEKACGCGCSEMTVVTEAREPCGCGCECCEPAGDDNPKPKEQEIAELRRMITAIDARLAQLEGA
jgi:hypothetical protein